MAKIWVAVVSGDNFTNFYASETEIGVTKQVANFCREHWDILGKFGFNLPAPEQDEEILETYYGYHDDEGCDIQEVEIL